MMNNLKIVIPARRNSKGFPFKNRRLLDFTLNIIPWYLKSSIIVTTDDEVIISKCKELGLFVVERNPELAQDTTSTKAVILDLLERNVINDNDLVIMLYLTYPERTFDDIMSAYNFFIKHEAKSLLCAKKIKGTHPHLYLLERDGNKGAQLIKHDLYRRQDYPNVFEVSHFISIFYGYTVKKLNNNLYNKDTIFFPINDTIDVDYPSDFNTNKVSCTS